MTKKILILLTAPFWIIFSAVFMIFCSLITVFLETIGVNDED